jgi:uncharacterized membrane protein
MVSASVHGAPVELSGERRMARRITRLGFVSLVALGLIWALSVASLSAPAAVTWALAAGWVLMPITLFASLARPRLRYALMVPASLVSIGMLAILLWWPPDDRLALVGWWLMTAGILLGGAMGLWFWYRLLPVPASLDDPCSPDRWRLIGLHVALIMVGWLLAATPLVNG